MAVRRSAGIGVAFGAILALGLAGAPALADSHMAGESGEHGEAMHEGMKEGASEKASLQGKIASKLGGTEGLSGVRAKAEEGTVTLRGKVAKASERDRAEELVRSIEGVESVENEIEVDAASPPGGRSSGGY